MINKISLYSFVVALALFSSVTVAQEKDKVKDTTQTKIIKRTAKVEEETKDTTLYKNIEKFSKKSKFTKLLHKAIFEGTSTKSSNPIRRPKNKVYKKYEGKIIRNINIETLDPFGYSVADTTKKPKNWAEETGNKLHLKSKEFAIRNLTLLKKNTPLDSLLVRETERLIRNQRFVSQVQITAQLASKNSDSVDVTVRVLDSWSIIPKGSISPNRTRFELIDRNFFGSGVDFSNKVTHENSSGITGYATRLIVPTIKSTYIRTTIEYRLELDGSYGKSLNMERRFFSPFTKWAGGFYVDQQFQMDSLANSSGDFANQNFKYNSNDIWAGRSFQLFKGNKEADRTTNFILATRFLHTGYIESPTLEYDPTHFYSGENFVMAGFGISSRQFVEDQYLFNYGIIEDVPIGKIYNLTAGYQQKNHEGRLYLGARASFGNYFKFGYLSTNFEYGTFFNDKKLEQSAFTFQANYFTNLIPLGERWKMRQFVKPQVVLGWNRLNIKDDQISINERSGFQGEYGAGYAGTNTYGIGGYNTELFGTKKLVLSLQTQFYSPWNLWGFRVNPYFNMTTALLGNEKRGLHKSPLYASFVTGIIISNDFLVFNSFQFSLAYYPSIPGQGYNIFQTNSFETTDFGFQDFELGKPRTVSYQ
ncbi:hypothetical protein FLAN108750_10015 [Flavobacterium antarcticum]|uniref:hypothetical protein n=1 Tax=Flavobacterium antarcticum TaxID=271155 RepID=UPI0003B7A990|nr:hypothetical protein [Flavobacterium antarcticum]